MACVYLNKSIVNDCPPSTADGLPGHASPGTCLHLAHGRFLRCEKCHWNVCLSQECLSSERRLMKTEKPMIPKGLKSGWREGR